MYAYFVGARRELTNPTFFDYYLDPAKTAVITVDMHKGHLDVDDPNCPCPAPRGLEIVGPINDFTAQARGLGIPIIHVISVLRKGGVDERKYPSAWRLLLQEIAGPIPGIDEHAIEGTKWNESSLHVAEEDLMVTSKKRLSPFYSSDLELLLRNLDIRTIVLVGAMADCCVLNCAMDGANRDFRVVWCQDLIRGTEELEPCASKIVSLHFGLVVNSNELTEQWKKTLSCPA